MATTPHKQPIKSSTKSLKVDKPAPPRDPAELAAMVSVDGVPQFNAVSLDKRYVPARLPTGRVIEVWGDAVMRTPEGEVHPLRAGDDIRKGDVILTAQNGIVQMEVEGSRSARLPFGSDLQGPLAQVNATDQFDAPGAGPGDPGSLSDGLRVDRVNESVTAQAFSFAGADGGGPGLGEITPNGVLDAGNQRPVVDVQNIVVPESGVIIAAGVQPAAVTGLPGFAVFTVHLNSPAVDPVTLGLTLTAGTATLGDAAQGGDFGSSGPFQGMEISTDDGVTWVATDQVAVPAGATQALVRVPLHNDTIDEFNETFTLTAQSLPGSTQDVLVIANATILDDDDPPTASFTAGTIDTSVPEGAGQATVTVTLSAPSGKPISIDWTTADGTATAGQDYSATTGTLTFAPGETSKTISIPISNDKLVEPDEKFTINLSNGVNVNLGPAASPTTIANVTIVNDDNAPVLLPQAPAAGNEDTTQTGNVLTGATDADGDRITIADYSVNGSPPTTAGTPTTLPGVGTIVINPDGGYSFTPAPNYNGPVPPVSFHATDGTNVTPGAIQLTIAPVNDAPVLVHQTPPPQLEDTTQTGNVLTGATDVDKDQISVVDFSVGGGLSVAAGTTTTLAGVGDFVVKSDGSYVFTPVLNYDGTSPPVPTITFNATDHPATGLTPAIVGGDIQLSITAVNDAPTVAPGTATVSELGLATTATTGPNAIVSSGTLAISDPDSSVLSVGFDTGTNFSSLPIVMVGGNPLHWSGSGSEIVGSIDSKDYLRASIDNTGKYTVTLVGPIDNPNAAGNIEFKVNVSDSVNTTPTTLTAHVVDDAPHVAATQTSVNVARSNSDVLLVLDTSGSMGTVDGLAGSRLVTAVNAFKQLLTDYAAQGDVHVRIVTFSDSATDQGGGWLSVTDAQSRLTAIADPKNLGDKTNFAAAIDAAITAYGNGSNTAGAKSVAYFLSDGLPTAGFEVNGTLKTHWENFLIAHSTKAVAVGFGNFQGSTEGGVDPLAAQVAMAPVAFDASGTPPQQSTPTLVSNTTDLNNLLASTVPPQVQGFLAGSSTNTGAAGGADHAHVAAVTIDGHTFTFDGQVDTSATGAGDHQFNSGTHVLTVTTINKGTLSIDMDDGRYGYQPPSNNGQAFNEQVTFTVTDRDGSSSATSTLDINVPVLATPAVVTTTAGTQAVDAGHVTALSATSNISTTGETLHASPLSDVFSWTLVDAGQPGAPGTTHVVGFDGQAASRGGDVLNLHDLLQGEVAGANGAVGNLGSYLDFSVVGSGDKATTTVQVSSHGGFTAGQAGTAAVDQVIVLDHLDIRGALGLDGHAANQQIIEAMLQQGKLVVDGSNA